MGKVLSFLSIVTILTTNHKAWAIENSVPAMFESANAVVQVTMNTYTTDAGENPGYCVGTVISDQYVITAAHCVAASTRFIDSIRVIPGRFIKKTYPKGNSTNLYYPSVPLKVKNVYVNSKIKAAFFAGKLPGVSDIKLPDDMVILELENKLDLVTLQIKPYEVITPEEYEYLNQTRNENTEILAISTSLIVNMNSARNFAVYSNLTIDGIMTSINGHHIWAYDDHNLEPGDSGLPLLVRIKGKLKVLGIAKGVRRIFNYSAFAPVAPNICNLQGQITGAQFIKTCKNFDAASTVYEP